MTFGLALGSKSGKPEWQSVTVECKTLGSTYACVIIGYKACHESYLRQ